MQPKDLMYTRSHEWVRVNGGKAIVGITDHAQAELGDVVYVELPKVGAVLSKGDVFGTVESVKTVSDLLAPVSGEIVQVNEKLPDTPEVVNEEPYDSGWMIELNMSKPDELGELMSSEQYESFIEEH